MEDAGRSDMTPPAITLLNGKSTGRVMTPEIDANRGGGDRITPSIS